jgi:hypothetical protein
MIKVIKQPDFKVLPMTDKEKKLSVSNAIMREVNSLTNTVKEKDYELKKLRQRILHLRTILKGPINKLKPTTNGAKKQTKSK